MRLLIGIMTDKNYAFNCIQFIFYTTKEKLPALSQPQWGNFLGSKYLLLIDFEVRTVSHGPSFSPSIYGPSAKRAGYKSQGKKNEDP